MKNISPWCHVLALLVLASTLSGCGGIKLTASEQATIQEILIRLTVLENCHEACQRLDAEEIRPNDLEVLAQGMHEIDSLIPPVLRDYPEDIPTRIDIEESQKVDILTTAYPLSQQTLEQAQALFAALAVPKLEQIASNLAIIWSVESVGIETYRRSPTYAEAHNAFLLARRQYPNITLEPAIQFSDQLVEFDAAANQLIPKTEDGPLPDILMTAEYIERCDKIFEKILFHYLTKRGDLVVTAGTDVTLAERETPAQDASASVGGRILMALDETFGPIDAMPTLVEQRFTVTFRRGGYALPHLFREDRAALQAQIQQLVTALQAHDPALPLVVTITTVGYTDATPLRENTRFAQHFIKSLQEAGEQIPTSQPQRKEALNKHYSRLRALIINEHIQQHIQDALPDRERLNIVSEIIGKGEELPDGFSDDSTSNDRRMCEVTVIAQSAGAY